MPKLHTGAEGAHIQPAPQPPRYRVPSLGSADHDDLLAYVGDMALELKALSDRTGASTLSGLLALASAEAEQRRRAG